VVYYRPTGRVLSWFEDDIRWYIIGLQGGYYHGFYILLSWGIDVRETIIDLRRPTVISK